MAKTMHSSLCPPNILPVFGSIAWFGIFMDSLGINIFVLKDLRVEQSSFLHVFPTFSLLLLSAVSGPPQT